MWTEVFCYWQCWKNIILWGWSLLQHTTHVLFILQVFSLHLCLFYSVSGNLWFVLLGKWFMLIFTCVYSYMYTKLSATCLHWIWYLISLLAVIHSTKWMNEKQLHWAATAINKDFVQHCSKALDLKMFTMRLQMHETTPCRSLTVISSKHLTD